MKNFIIGMSILLLCAVFITFQADINSMQRHQYYLHSIADEAASAGALEIKDGDNSSELSTQNYANGFIKFIDNRAAAKCMESVKKNLNLDEGLIPQGRYFKDKITVIFFTFSQDGKYSKYRDGVLVESGRFSRGDRLDKFTESPYAEKLKKIDIRRQIRIMYPSTVCIIDAGRPKFTCSKFIGSVDEIDICKVGMYEYKEFDLEKI